MTSGFKWSTQDVMNTSSMNKDPLEFGFCHVKQDYNYPHPTVLASLSSDLKPRAVYASSVPYNAYRCTEVQFSPELPSACLRPQLVTDAIGFRFTPCASDGLVSNGLLAFTRSGSWCM